MNKTEGSTGAAEVPAGGAASLSGRRVMLYFGSFNPVHFGHIAIAEYAIERNLADIVVLVVSPQNPFKDAAGLAPEFERYEGAEKAALASRFPDRILVSAVEFTLPRPSYTIDTLRFLTAEFPDTEFSILMGGDNASGLATWCEADKILGRFPIYVYPRAGNEGASGGSEGSGSGISRDKSSAGNESAADEVATKFPAGVIVLSDAPLLDVSSTKIRAAARGETL